MLNNLEEKSGCSREEQERVRCLMNFELSNTDIFPQDLLTEICKTAPSSNILYQSLDQQNSHPSNFGLSQSSAKKMPVVFHRLDAPGNESL